MEMQRKKRILFLSRDRGSVQAIAPVAAMLSSQGDVEPVVVSFRNEQRTYQRLGIAPILVDEQAFLLDRRRFIHDVLDRYCPDAIVMGSSNPITNPPETPEQYLALLGRGRRLPTVAVMDTWGYYRERFGLAEEYGCDLTLLPDWICVLDKICYQDLLDLGVPAEKMIITHNPWMDESTRAAQSPPAPAKSVRPGAFNILFVSQPLAEVRDRQGWPYTQHDLFKALCAAASRLRNKPHVRILVWLHPAEDHNAWSGKLDTTTETLSIVLSKERGPEVLAHVDAMVTSHSTATYEALYFGTPCIMLRLGHPPVVPHLPDRLGLTAIVSGESELLAQLSDIQPGRRAEIQAETQALRSQQVMFSDGRATDRVTRVVRRLIAV